jgi:hypothetical protein
VLERVVVTLLIGATGAAIAMRARDLTGFVMLGAKEDRVPHDWKRKLKDQLVIVLGQRKLLQWTIPGLMHFFIFWGFVILFTTIVESFGAFYQEGFHLPLVGRWGPLAALQDTFMVAVLIGVTTALAIRHLQRPGRFRVIHRGPLFINRRMLSPNTRSASARKPTVE